MKVIKLFLVAIVVIFASTAHADGEYIGPAFRVDNDSGCSIFSGDYLYEGTYFIQFSNGKKGHATYKCKVRLTEGEGVIYYSEYDADGFPLSALGYPDAMCYATIELDIDAGMWTAQCFNAWESGE